jgi:hypothetical protein
MAARQDPQAGKRGKTRRDSTPPAKGPQPRKRQQGKHPTGGGGKKQLVYRISEATGGIVFATPDRAAFVDRLYGAIHGSKTWAEFRRAMPRAEYSSVLEGQEKRPKGTAPFGPEDVPGYFDGDYPPWLSQEMDRFLPNEVVERFGEGEMTMLNGGFTFFDPQHLPAILAALEEKGFAVEEREDLYFP